MRRTMVAGFALCAAMLGAVARGDFINEDVMIVAPNATDFEILLRGNKVNKLGDKFISPFNNGAQVNFNAGNNTTTIRFVAPNGQAFGMGRNHFGFALSGAPNFEGAFDAADVIAKLVSFGPNPPPQPPDLKVPALDIVFNRMDPTFTAALNNQSDDTLSLSGVGYLITSTEIPLEDLNRVDLPPGAFLPAGIPDGTLLLPGQSIALPVSAPVGQYLTVFAQSQFAGASSGNAYTGVVGEWAEARAVPEPSSLAMLAAGGLAVVGCAASRGRRGRS